MYRITKLENGLSVCTAQMPHVRSVSIGIWVAVGSRYENARLNGACHFIEHLLFKGTKKRSAREISQAVEGIGGYLNAFTSEEATCFHARARSDRFDELLDVLMDMVLRSRFAPADIAKEREVIKEEIAMYLDEPQHHVQELLNTLLWPGQPLGRPITGTGSTLDGMGRSALLEYLRQNYVAENSFIVAAGNVRHTQALQAAKKFARHFSRACRPSFNSARNDQKAPRVCLFSKQTEQTQIALGIRTCSRHDPRRYALRLANAILGENMSSRLFQVIREDRGLAYSIYSSPSFFADTGDLVISAGLDTDNLTKVLRLVVRELKRMAQTPPDRAELRRAQDYVIGQIELGQESTENQMNWVGEQMAGYGRVVPAAAVKRQLNRVSAMDIRNAARMFFRPEHLNLALVSPLKSDRGLLGLLEKVS
jgi:predicted Zn-dependent peptidase